MKRKFLGTLLEIVNLSTQHNKFFHSNSYIFNTRIHQFQDSIINQFMFASSCSSLSKKKRRTAKLWLCHRRFPNLLLNQLPMPSVICYTPLASELQECCKFLGNTGFYKLSHGMYTNNSIVVCGYFAKKRCQKFVYCFSIWLIHWKPTQLRGRIICERRLISLKVLNKRPENTIATIAVILRYWHKTTNKSCFIVQHDVVIFSITIKEWIQKR